MSSVKQRDRFFATLPASRAGRFVPPARWFINNSMNPHRPLRLRCSLLIASGEYFPAPQRKSPARPSCAQRCNSLWRASIAVVCLVVSSPLPARADFRVCNKTRALINLAVGANAAGDFSTEGWWVVTPGSCVIPIRGPLKGRYLYLYASDINGMDVLKGTVSMCIDRAKFKVIGIENCWRRGLQAVTFTEVDTLDSPDWTTFLTDVGN
jgi:uncharacterized membrane protein